MDKKLIAASSLVALTFGANLVEALWAPESAEPDCRAAAPCTLREQVALQAWLPETPESLDAQNSLAIVETAVALRIVVADSISLIGHEQMVEAIGRSAL